MAFTITLENEIDTRGELLLHLPHLTDAEFYAFCQRNDLMAIERTAQGDISVMAPADGFSDSRNTELTLDLGNWNRSLPTPGITFGPSAGFTLPNGAVRSPDAAWISAQRWNGLPPHLRAPFPHIAPDFVVEIMSPSDRLSKMQEKMVEYRDNGVRLGWLIDRSARMVYVYRPGNPVESYLNPATVTGDPELPGLVVDMARVLQDSL